MDVGTQEFARQRGKYTELHIKGKKNIWNPEAPTKMSLTYIGGIVQEAWLKWMITFSTPNKVKLFWRHSPPLVIFCELLLSSIKTTKMHNEKSLVNPYLNSVYGSWSILLPSEVSFHKESTSYTLMDYPGTYVPVRARRQNDFTFQIKEPCMLLEKE